MAKKVDMANEYCADYFRRPVYESEVAWREGTMKSPVEQSHKDSCDVNEIVRRYREGVPPDLSNSGPGHYGDFSNITSYADAMIAVKAAETAFMGLPPEVRHRFGHDPGSFISFCEDPANAEEMVKMGLAKKDGADKGNEVAHESGSSKKASGDASMSSADSSKKA